MISIKHQASSISIKHQASSIKHQASSIKHQASSIKHQASSIKHHIIILFSLSYLIILHQKNYYDNKVIPFDFL
ncbi:hypothetical protein [Brachyspira innocens]|uniref:hypothetical protein n=1 Tax=Brachyspira innocens TaxID=13264 RepID=UPI0026ECC1A2|nr:hypothetical protein [Brachyspira innocens]